MRKGGGEDRVIDSGERRERGRGRGDRKGGRGRGVITAD